MFMSVRAALQLCVNVAEKSTYQSVCSCAGGKLQHLGLSSGLPNSVVLTCCLS